MQEGACDGYKPAAAAEAGGRMTWRAFDDKSLLSVQGAEVSALSDINVSLSRSHCAVGLL